MQIFDPKFKDNKLHYFIQCGIATVSVFIILLILDAIQNTAIIAALGASSFIAFAMPNAKVSKTRYLLGGYAVGTSVGVLCQLLMNVSFVQKLPLIEHYPTIFFGALAVGIAILIMAITNTEHPPAAGLALGIVLNEITLKIILVIVIGISGIVILKKILKPLLRDLI
jgi:CBS-domain-containing membrane protein